MRNLCNIFRKLALGNEKEFKESIRSLYEGNSVDECEEEMRKHIKSCHICYGTIEQMKSGDIAFINALLKIEFEYFNSIQKKIKGG